MRTSAAALELDFTEPLITAAKAVAETIARNGSLQRDTLLWVFPMAQDIAFTSSYVRDHSTLKASPALMPIFAYRDEASLASQTIEDQRQHLDTSWVGHPARTARFAAFRGLSEEAPGAWVAYSIAQTLEATLNIGDGGRVNGLHGHLGRLLGIEVAHWWRPTSENFFNRVKKDVMLDALEMIGGPILRGRYKDAKKGDLAATCASLCNGQGIVEAEIREKASAWLPDGMRFDGIEKAERVSPRSSFVIGSDGDDPDLNDDDAQDDPDLADDDRLENEGDEDEEGYSQAA